MDLTRSARLFVRLVVASVLLVQPPAALSQEDTRPGPGSHGARDTLYLVGVAGIDSIGPALWEAAPSVARAAWRRALAFAEWNPGAVIVGGPASAYANLARHDSTLADSVRAAIRSGAWEPVGGWWTDAEPRSLSGEALIRQSLYGQRFLREEFGRTARVGWFLDADHLPGALPQLLTGAGIEALVARHRADATSAAREGDPDPAGAFDWIGDDGSRVFVYRPIRYGAFADFEFEFPGPQAVPEGDGRNGVALYGVRDPGWKPDEEDRVPANPVLTGKPPLVRFAGPAEAIPSVRASFSTIAIHHGPIALGSDRGSGHGRAAVARPPRQLAKNEVNLRSAEALAAISAGLPGGADYPTGPLADAWRRHLEGGVERSAADRALQTLALSRFADIRAEMETDEEDSGAFVLFNPLGHPIHGAAFVEIVAVDDTGNSVPSAFTGGDPLLLEVGEVPSLGAVSVPIGADGLPSVASEGLPSPTAGDLWIENAFLRVAIDPSTGAIVSILDKSNRRQVLRPGGRANVLWVTPQSRTGDISETVSPRAPDDPAEAPLSLDEPGELRRLVSVSSSVTARVAKLTVIRGWGRSKVRQELLLTRSSRILEIQTELDWQDAGWQIHVSFDPAGVPESTIFEAPYGTVNRPAGPGVADPGGTAPLPAVRDSHWADVTANGLGFSVISDAPAGWRFEDGRLRLWPVDRPTTESRLRYAIYPHAGSWQEAETHLLAAAYTTPLLAGREPPHGGRLKRRFSFLTVEPSTVEAAWLKRSEEESDFVLRLVERSGRASEATVHTACPEVSAYEADHLEDPSEALPTRGSSFWIRLRANEIATVRFRCGG
jgi:alpha-mannosidase